MALTNYINVLVHGLFFMWFNPETRFLELIAPAVDPKDTPEACRHRLLGGIRLHLQEYKDAYKHPVDWTKILKGSEHLPKPDEVLKNLKSSILQFSMGEVGTQGWSDKPENFIGKFILPWPIAFYSLRHDYFTRSFVYKDSEVGKKIKNRCYSNPNSEIGLVTCLLYTYEEGTESKIRSQIPKWRADTNLHCYFEPCKKHSIEQVNKDLKNARAAFKYPDAFDLELDENAMKDIVTPIGRNPITPPGYDKNDEYSLTDDPEKPEDICRGTDGCPGIVNVSPANCPNFFVGP